MKKVSALRAKSVDAMNTDVMDISKQTDLEKRLRRAELLLGISRKLVAIDSLDGILQTLVEMTSRELGAERGTLFLNDSQTGELYSIAAQGNFRRRISMLNTSGIAGQVFQSGKGIIAHDVYKEEYFNRDIDKETGYKTRNMICTPLRTTMGEIIGVAQVLNKKEKKFTRADMELLDAMTMQAAMFLQGAQVIEKMQRSRARELEFLDIVADVTSEIDLGTLLRKVMGEATRMLQAERSTIFLNDQKNNELWSLRSILPERHGRVSGQWLRNDMQLKSRSTSWLLCWRDDSGTKLGLENGTVSNVDNSVILPSNRYTQSYKLEQARILYENSDNSASKVCRAFGISRRSFFNHMAVVREEKHCAEKNNM